MLKFIAKLSRLTGTDDKAVATHYTSAQNIIFIITLLAHFSVFILTGLMAQYPHFRG